MIVTEAEAKTKRCQESFPAAQSISPDGAMYASSWQYPPPPMAGAGVSTAVHTAPSLCIGSACMAWRWQLSGHTRGVNLDLGDDHSYGYCGKAGRP